jgi:hypothetical protein
VVKTGIDRRKVVTVRGCGLTVVRGITGSTAGANITAPANDDPFVLGQGHCSESQYQQRYKKSFCQHGFLPYPLYVDLLQRMLSTCAAGSP